MSTWDMKVDPGLAAGSTIVLKTTEFTPLSALYVFTLIKKAGLHPSTLNIILGKGKTGHFISFHMKIKKIASIGSTANGRHVTRAAA